MDIHIATHSLSENVFILVFVYDKVTEQNNLSGLTSKILGKSEKWGYCPNYFSPRYFTPTFSISPTLWG